MNIKLKTIAQVAAVTAAVVVTNTYAALPGAYLGGQLGWGVVHDQGITGDDFNRSGFPTTGISTSNRDNGIAGRVFAGYQFDPNWAVELGYSKFSNVKTSGSATGFGPFNFPFSVGVDGTIKTYAIDLVAKGILPLSNGFSVYGKAGAAYLNETADVTAAVKVLGIPFGSFGGSETEHKILPTFGAGVAYDVTSNVSADLSWNRIQKVGNTDLSSTDLVALGLSYSFA